MLQLRLLFFSRDLTFLVHNVILEQRKKLETGITIAVDKHKYSQAE